MSLTPKFAEGLKKGQIAIYLMTNPNWGLTTIARADDGTLIQLDVEKRILEGQGQIAALQTRQHYTAIAAQATGMTVLDTLNTLNSGKPIIIDTLQVR